MASDRLRTVSVDLPDPLVRRIARHVGRDGKGGFSAIVEQALDAWAEREEARERSRRESGIAKLEQPAERRHEAV